jgi:ABC-type transport system substrate-binding protein
MEPMPWQPRFALAQDPDPNKRQDIFIMYSWPLSPAPIQLLQDAVGTGKSLAVSYYSNPVVDNLMSAAANIAGIDRAGAAAIIAEVQNIVRADAPVVPIADLNMNAVKSVTLKGPSSAFSNPAYPRIVFWYSVYRD